MLGDNLRRWLTQRFWRTRYADFDFFTAEVSWFHQPFVRAQYINMLVSGQPEQDWLAWFQQKYYPRPVKRGLSLGCGTGETERRAVEINLCLQLDGYDLSPDAIAQARSDAERAGVDGRLHFSRTDLNALTLPASAYDLILCPMSLHHVRNLERLFSQARSALCPGGLLVLNEYVGPDRFQWGEKQLRYANALLHKLPQRYRRNLAPRRWRRWIEPYRTRVRRRWQWRLMMEDPSEAIRSSEIVPALEQEFEIVERRDYGGTLLCPVLDRIAGNFTENEADRELLLEAFAYEQELIRQGELSSDYTVIVARPRV
ncbi:MAG: class I SAM-dependent methyltransferase [Terriglobia bacterium]